MKRFLTFALLASMALTGHAQEIYRITEPIAKSFTNLVIDSGCYVQLKTADTTLLTVETINPGSLALNPVAICQNDTLHITCNPHILSDSSILLSLAPTQQITYIKVCPGGHLDLRGSNYNPKKNLTVVSANNVYVDSLNAPYASKMNIVLDESVRKAHASLTLGFGLKLPFNAPIHDSPYTTTRSAFTIVLPLITTIPMSSKYAFYSGVQMSWGLIPFQNKVTYSDGALHLRDDADATTARNMMLRTDISLLYDLLFYLPDGNNVTCGLTFTRLIRGSLMDLDVADNNRWDISKQKTQIYNPWQIAVNAGINLKGFNVSFYVNLLPTYRADIDAPKIHEFGMTFGF